MGTGLALWGKGRKTRETAAEQTEKRLEVKARGQGMQATQPKLERWEPARRLRAGRCHNSFLQRWIGFTEDRLWAGSWGEVGKQRNRKTDEVVTAGPGERKSEYGQEETEEGGEEQSGFYPALPILPGWNRSP